MTQITWVHKELCTAVDAPRMLRLAEALLVPHFTPSSRVEDGQQRVRLQTASSVQEQR